MHFCTCLRLQQQLLVKRQAAKHGVAARLHLPSMAEGSKLPRRRAANQPTCMRLSNGVTTTAGYKGAEQQTR